MATLDQLIDAHAARVGVDPNYLRRLMQVESGGRAGTRSSGGKGSYHGLFQLSKPQFTKYGGKGDIYDPEQQVIAAANRVADDRAAFTTKYGREPSPTETYMYWQQGRGGYAAHAADPNRPAWQSMAATGEGRQKGEKWAKRAIWGNLTPEAKQRFGNVDNVTSGGFMDFWRNRFEGGGPQMGGASPWPGPGAQPGGPAPGMPGWSVMEPGPVATAGAPGVPAQAAAPAPQQQNPLMAMMKGGGQMNPLMALLLQGLFSGKGFNQQDLLKMLTHGFEGKEGFGNVFGQLFGGQQAQSPGPAGPAPGATPRPGPGSGAWGGLPEHLRQMYGGLQS